MLLSNIARIFDPIGGLSPIVFWCKCLLQSLWKLNIGWDELVPLEVMNQWEEFTSQIETLAEVQIPHFICNVGANDYQLIGFCNASDKGYGAVIYLRSVSPSGDIKIAFILAKSKEAPLKVLTIPKLELCVALLLAHLVFRIMNVYRGRILFNKILAWTDSQTVLSWLNTPSHILKMFVANRVVEINDCIPYSGWKYVPSKLNPANCISQGLTPMQLSEARLYWEGPPFLTLPESDWPLGNSTLLDYQALPELKAHSITVGTLGVQADPLSWIRRLSSYIKVVRVMAYVLRFRNAFKGFRYKRDTPLSGTEWFCNFYFGNYYSALRGGGRLPPSLALLRPFVDEDGCIRVGGHLQHSLLASGNKQPWLLPKDDVNCTPLPFRIVEALISQKFWILSVRVVIKSELTKCVCCCQYRGNVLEPIMADLPASRVTPQRPFAVIGVDYGGPFLYKCSNRRNVANHRPISVFLFRLLRPSLLAHSWQHFGGLWEAGIKSVKFHLRRIIHGHALNFEEYSTLFYRIEAVLNSRPLVPLSADPSEINCLTPGHFLIDLPDADPQSQDSAASLSARWKLVKQIKNNFGEGGRMNICIHCSNEQNGCKMVPKFNLECYI
ncbi:hypothetical protein J437_LFUL000941 [Ladona fulva]|uniref:Uncharacterized protein n=1 Tax=Ladona fulva TaxID=123851 RepID=A0A8K0K6T7_LADFU|nr:hypothetical protein J437_LFUL000941 [Ladona fulva]